jgi:STE24 endopeptidase
MQPDAFQYLFLTLLVAGTAARFYLSWRQGRHVSAHRQAVPPAFASQITLEQHQKAADYTEAKRRLTSADLALEALWLAALTVGGVINTIALYLQAQLGEGYLFGLALFGVSALISSVIGLPLSLYQQFGLEQRFGFNNMTWRMWLIDTLKGTLLGVALGTPLLFGVLWLMQAMGDTWWLYVWLFWMSFNLLMLAVYPTWIAPLFNTFTPLADAALAERIEGLLTRCGFASSGLFVMDGSRRSGHGNAYFTGLGKAKRIVFFDTLLSRLRADEVEAVLAHELGHFHHRHVLKRIVLMAIGSAFFLRLLAWLMTQEAFFTGLGVSVQGTAMALLLFSLVLPVFLFPITPVFSVLSRRDEFEADAYAVRHASGGALVTALVALYRDNAATLTPDPLHSLVYDSHPPAAVRIAHIEQLGRLNTGTDAASSHAVTA